MLQYSKKDTKRKIKDFMRDYGRSLAEESGIQRDTVDVTYYGTAVTPELIIKKLFRKMTIEEAQTFLDNLEKRDQTVEKKELSDGTMSYFIKFKRKRRHY